MAHFLSQNGLSYLWSQIKNYWVKVSELSNLTASAIKATVTYAIEFIASAFNVSVSNNASITTKVIRGSNWKRAKLSLSETSFVLSHDDNSEDGTTVYGNESIAAFAFKKGNVDNGININNTGITIEFEQGNNVSNISVDTNGVHVAKGTEEFDFTASSIGTLSNYVGGDYLRFVEDSETEELQVQIGAPSQSADKITFSDAFMHNVNLINGSIDCDDPSSGSSYPAGIELNAGSDGFTIVAGSLSPQSRKRVTLNADNITKLNSLLTNADALIALLSND